MKLLDTLLLYGGLGLFLIGLGALYEYTNDYITVDKYSASKAMIFAFGETYTIFMGMLCCLGYYKLRKMQAKEANTTTPKSK